jgi:hypothetical protein
MKKKAKQLFLLFSHTLTEEQIQEAQTQWGIKEFIYLPDELQQVWSNICPEGELDFGLLEPIKSFLQERIQFQDYVLIQGDFGAVYHMVNWCFEHDLISLYATTKREYKTKENIDGTITNIHIFQHVNFRKYIR